MDILIKNGTIINADRQFNGDILIRGKLINSVSNSILSANTQLIDAAGKYIFPGGIDPHVHLHLPTPAGYSSDDFLSGSKAALFGGTTSIIDFVTPERGQSLVEAFMLRQEEAKETLTDFSFHVSPVDLHENIEDEIDYCIRSGITSFKLYMAYKKSIGVEDKVLLSIMSMVAKAGGMVTVHCELGDEIEKNRNAFFNAGKTSPDNHPLSRPNELEAQAVRKAIDFAKEACCPVYIVHVSTKEALVHIRKAQKEGQNVYAETCPQYLLLDQSKYSGTFKEIAPHILSPPYRTQQDITELWRALSDGCITSIGSDHCPFMLTQKDRGKNDFRDIPNGVGGIEHRLALLYTYGVKEQKISLSQFVALISTNPAKIFGMYPQKGIITAGADADLIIWDPEFESIISVENHHQNCDTNIFEGIKTNGRAETVIVGGEIVIKNALFQSNTKPARFIKRKI